MPKVQEYICVLQDGEVPEDVDWSFVLHVNGSDGSVHKVNYKTMVESKHRFDHNRTGKYSGAKRGSEEVHGKLFNGGIRNDVAKLSPSSQLEGSKDIANIASTNNVIGISKS